MWRVAGALFIVFPVVRIILEPPATLVAVTALAATALFAFLIAAVARSEPDDARRARIGFALVDVAIIALSVATVANSPDQGWVLLFYYASSAASMLLPGAPGDRAHRRGGRCVRGESRGIAGRAECVHPGPLGLHHRDHDLRDGRAATDEPGALRRSR